MWFLIDYIKSFSSYKDESAYGYDFNPDSMIISALSLFMVILGVLSYIKIYKKRYSPLFCANVLLIIVSSSFIYGLARLIKMYVKQKDPTIYWIWFAVGLFTIAICLGLSLYFYFQRKKKTKVSNQSA